MEDTKQLELILRGLVVSSVKVLTASNVLHEFEVNEGRKFPLRNLGFSSFVDYLKSIPSVVMVSLILSTLLFNLILS